MSGVLWSKFYWSDWESDPKLRLCSPSAQALWMRMLCICAQSEPQGYLMLNGRSLAAMDLAAIIGWPSHDVEMWLGELGQWGVYSVDRRGRIYSRRMVLDAKKAKIARKNGKNGGNPSLGKHKGNSASDNQNTTTDLRPKSQEPRAKSQKPEEDKDATASSVAADVGDVVRQAFDEWNELADRLSLPRAKTLDRSRRASIIARLREEGPDGWRRALRAVERSPHCRGENDRGWRADLDFVCQPKSWRRLLEGFYGDDGPPDRAEVCDTRSPEQVEAERQAWQDYINRLSEEQGHTTCQ